MFNQKEINLLNSGKEAFKNAEYKKAQILLSDLIKINNRNSEAYFLLGNIFHLKGEIGKAIKAFNRVLALDPCHTDASISLSILYNDIGRYEEGKKIFDATSERVKRKNSGDHLDDKHVNKKFSNKHFELAELYMSYNRYDEALFEYNKVVALNPANLEAKIKIAKVYSQKGFTSKALDELRRLKNENPAYSKAGIALGILYYGNGKIIEAQNEWKRVLAKDGTNADAKMYMNLSRTATETTL